MRISPGDKFAEPATSAGTLGTAVFAGAGSAVFAGATCVVLAGAGFCPQPTLATSTSTPTKNDLFQYVTTFIRTPQTQAPRNWRLLQPLLAADSTSLLAVLF